MENIIDINEKTKANDGLDDLFYRVELNEEESEHLAAEPYSYWKSVFHVFIRKPAAIISIIAFAILLLGVIIIPLFTPADAFATENINTIKNASPSSEHLWGCDILGRDLFYLTWTGARTSLYLGLISSLVVLVIGTILGLIWGYLKKLDWLFIEIYNLISNIPSLLIFMLLATIFREAFPTWHAEARLVISLSLTGWLGLSLMIRNMVLIIDNREYNIASKTLATPASRIMFKNYLPFIFGVIITEFSLIIPGMISCEVTMSYFGVGLPETAYSIGAIMKLGIENFNQYPWQLLAPAALLALIIFIFFLFGMAFSDALDPKKHR